MLEKPEKLLEAPLLLTTQTVWLDLSVLLARLGRKCTAVLLGLTTPTLAWTTLLTARHAMMEKSANMAQSQLDLLTALLGTTVSRA